MFYIKNKTLYESRKESDKVAEGNGSWIIDIAQIPLDEVDEIVYITDRARYRINLSFALGNGNFYFVNGFEQFICPIKHWIIDFITEGKKP